MNSVCVMFYVFSFMFVPINGKCEEFIVENINCSTAACEKLTVNAMYLSTLLEPRKRMMAITSDHNNFYGALISGIGNVSINYGPIISGNCGGVYNFVGPRPSNSIGVILKSLPVIERNGIHWYHHQSHCNSKKCEFSTDNFDRSSGYPFTEDPYSFCDVEIESDPSACQDGESSLNLVLRTRKKYVELDSTGFSMLILLSPRVELTKNVTDGGKLITFRSIENLSSHQSLTVRNAVLTDMHDKRTYAISMKASDPKEVSVDWKSTNLPVACFFDGHPFGKVYEIFFSYEGTSNLPKIYSAELTWSMSIGFGNHPLYRSAASAIPVFKTFGLLVPALFFVFFIKKLQFEASL